MDQYFYDVPAYLWSMQHQNMDLAAATEGLKLLGKFNPKKMTQFILKSELYNGDDQNKETLNRKEFLAAAHFVENEICNLDAQVFDMMDGDKSGFIDAKEIEQGLLVLFGNWAASQVGLTRKPRAGTRRAKSRQV